MHTLDFEPFKQSGVNITGLQMVDPSRKETVDIINKWINWEMNKGKGLNITEKTLTVKSFSPSF